MKESVCSWICVTACRIEISRPTTRAASSIGSATFMVTPIMSTIRGDDFVLGHDMWKLWTSDEVTRFQPSTRMNSRILNGSEMKTGGSIIMPIDINVDETTRSMIRNGRKIRKPIWKAVLSSEMMNAGIRTCVGTSLRVLTFSVSASLTKSARSLSRVWFEHELAQRRLGALERHFLRDRALLQRVVGLVLDRP